MTTAASTIATPPPTRHASGSPPSSTEKLPLPACKKRAILLAIENECANIEKLLKAKGDLAAKKAFEDAKATQPLLSSLIDSFIQHSSVRLWLRSIHDSPRYGRRPG